MLKNAPAGNPRAPRPNPLADCPLTAAYAAIGGKWKLTLLYWIAREESHFASLRRRAAPISHKVLSEQLRELEAEDLVSRVPLGPVPAPVRYRLTSYGLDVLPALEAVRRWGQAHLQRAPGMAGDGVDCAAALPRGPAPP
jgi:DNA-binding HxlR family transcriptional regulator